MGLGGGWGTSFLQILEARGFRNNCWERLNSKLMRCSRDLLRWSAQKKKLSKKELKEKRVELKTLQYQERPNLTAIKTLENEIDLWQKQENLKWKQRAWYKGEDQNTKFFHARVSQR